MIEADISVLKASFSFGVQVCINPLNKLARSL